MVSTRRCLLTHAFLVIACFNIMIMAVHTVTASPNARPAADRSFTEAGNEEYRFDTGVLRGTLRSDGRSIGLTSVTHVPSGTGLDDAEYGILSHYRVFTSNERYGHAAWDWPSKSKLLPDGSVQVFWPSGDDHPFELTVTYRWHSPKELDCETTIRALRDLSEFEMFVASYFQKQFFGSSVYAKHNAPTEFKCGFMSTEQRFGDWQMFPRDKSAVSLIEDGRWLHGKAPVQWSIRQDLASPLAIRRDPKSRVCAVFMAPPEDCFAISSPHQGDGHYSMYLSLFGQTVKAGETATARCRFAVVTSQSDEKILELYHSYLKGRKQGAVK